MFALVAGASTAHAAEPSCPRELSAMQAHVFGLDICASKGITPVAFSHARGVAAQYLDNDSDGVADNPLVAEKLFANRAVLILAPDEDAFEALDLDELDDRIAQDLRGEEILPNAAANGEFDATLEEVLHVISQAGLAYAYPDVFGEQPGSELALAMDKARGGYFEEIPREYPENAWYTYDDETCDYACMMAEYFYWSLTSLLGGQGFAGRYQEIAHEWRANTPEKLRKFDPDVVRLLEDRAYLLPKKLPDGDYPAFRDQ